MIKRIHRITRETYPDWKTPKKQWNGVVLRCVFFPPHSPTARVAVAIVVAKKYAKHAVDRHLFKRRVSAAITHTGFLSLLSQERVVIFPLRPLEQITYTDIQTDIVNCIAATPWESAS